MKRPLNLFDGFFLMGLFLILADAPHAPKLGHLFLIYIAEWFYTVADHYLDFDKTAERVAFWLWKLKTKRAVKKASNTAAKSANPGQTFDKAKTGGNY